MTNVVYSTYVDVYNKITNYFLGSTAAADEIHLEQNQAPSKKINFSDMAERFADG